MATDLPLATNESTPISVPVASSDATTDLSSPNPDQVIEENPVESDPKRQKVENADYNISYDGSTKKEQLLLEDVEKDEEEEKFRLYVKRMKETDGFDLRDLPLPKTLCGGVLPVDIDTDEYVRDCVDFVIREHNENTYWGMNLELCEILMANWSICEGTNYYITFRAVDLSSKSKFPKEYEARVWHRWDGRKETGIFREKGSSKQPFKHDDQIVW
ncbi:hypothetical protein LINGRAHAP2_LOCUS30321 [Linum grandiflorum]